MAISRQGDTRWLDVHAALDTGAGRSLFDGQIGVALGFGLLDGPPLVMSMMTGTHLETRVHPVRLHHTALGEFRLDVAFSTAPISRNVLGRDFLNMVQVGFRENQLTFYVAAEP